MKYFTNSAVCRSTSTFHSSCAAEFWTGPVGTTIQTTCHSAGQLCVNHDWVEFAATLALNCTPSCILLLLSSNRCRSTLQAAPLPWPCPGICDIGAPAGQLRPQLR